MANTYAVIPEGEGARRPESPNWKSFDLQFKVGAPSAPSKEATGLGRPGMDDQQIEKVSLVMRWWWSWLGFSVYMARRSIGSAKDIRRGA